MTRSMKVYRNIFTIVILSLVSSVAAQNRTLELLRCEHLVNPIGVDRVNPRFSWRMVDERPDIKQTSYSIIVSENHQNIQRGVGDVWQSGKISSEKNLISYTGKALKPKTRYYWTVLVWDQDGEMFTAKETSFFETGKMNEAWRAKWISDNQDTLMFPAPHFRKEFNISKKVSTARAYVAVAGLIELSVNGESVGDCLLNPMFTRYDRRCLYLTYDVTDQLRQGKNALGVLLGNGWYNFQSHAVWDFENAEWRNRPAFCLEIDINYSDGTSETVYSDTGWKTALGPLVFNSIYTGEHYDARKELPEWNLPGFSDEYWSNAIEREAPAETITTQVLNPIRVVDEFSNLECTKVNDSVYLYKLPENIAGISKLRIQGERGTTIRLKHGETVDKNNRVDQSTIDIYSNQKNGLDPFQTDIYILKGDGIEEFMPRFNYKGFQYVEVTADRPVKLNTNNLIAYRINSDVRPIGRIESSNELVNKIWAATNRAYISNLHGYPTDCPQREKNGWTGDAHIALDAALYNYDGISVYEKWMADHRDAQLANGMLPAIIPTSGWGYTWGNGPDWTSTMLIVPWTIYLFYGDTQILADNYDNMKLFVDYISSVSVDYLTDWGLGDWVPYETIADKKLLISLYYYQDALLLSKIATLLDKKKDAKQYNELAVKIKNVINKTFFDKQKAIYATGCQAELSCPLYFDIVPEEYKQKVADNLAKRVIADNKHLDVGLLGSKTLLGALADNGYADLAFEVATQTSYPSWGWWIANGATTLYETWKIETETLSRNHVMFGEISAWFNKTLGGIHVDEKGPGFHSVIVKPKFVKALDNFSVEFESANGKIISFWERVNNQIAYHLTIPANSEAVICLDHIHSVIDIRNGQKLKTELQNGNYTLGSGSYRFVINEK